MEAIKMPATKDELLAQIRDEFAAFVALVDQIPGEKRFVPIAGRNSLKDIVAHISDWEAWMLLRLRSAAAGEYLPSRSVVAGLSSGENQSQSDIDAINDMIYERFKDAAWTVVWEDLLRTHEESLIELDQLSEKDLFDPLRVKQVTGIGEGAAIDMIYGNTSEHYREHSDELRAAFGL